MNVNPKECQKLTVSENTARFISCLNTMQSLYSEVYAALEHMYNHQTCEELMNKQFSEEFSALEQNIQRFMMFSIKEHIGTINSNKI